EEVVDREAVDAVEPTEPAAECQPRDPGRGDDAAGRCEAVDRSLAVQFAPRDAALSPNGLRDGIDVDSLQLGQIDHDAAVRRREAGHAVSAAAHRGLEPGSACEANGRNDVGGPATTSDQRWALVDQAVVNPARFLVAVVARGDECPGEVVRQNV